MNTESLTIGGIDVEVHRKKVKNLHVGVYPPKGHVRVAAPEAMSMDAIRIAVLTRMAWIRRKQAQFCAQERQAPRRYFSGETHYLFGRPRRLDVTESDRKTHRIREQGTDRLCLLVPAGSTQEDRRKWMRKWHRDQLRMVAGPRVSKWADELSVTLTSWGIREMKTKWGSCNPDTGSIWINAELSQKPVSAIDYVILHELTHLIARRHDDLFVATLEKHMPKWRQVRSELNTRPLSAWQG